MLSEAAATGAIPYDIPGVELSHEGELCSFDAFLREYRLTDPALRPGRLRRALRGSREAQPETHSWPPAA